MNKFILKWIILLIISIILPTGFYFGYTALVDDIEIIGMCIMPFVLQISIFILYGYYVNVVPILESVLEDNKTWLIWLKVLKLSLVVGIIMMISGIGIFFFGKPMDDIYNVDEVEVLEVSGNNLTIDYTDYNHGDKGVLTIKKPFFVKIKKGDLVSVRYHVDNPSKMHYVINAKVGVVMLIIGIILCSLRVLQWLVLTPYVLIKHKGRIHSEEI